jgi:hypothetical protein
MNNNEMTVKMWDEITEIQAESLNGGSGSSKFGFYGPVGTIQINEGDGVQINPGTINQSVNNFGRGRRRYH